MVTAGFSAPLPLIDIIIPVYRDLAVTRACIESVLASTLPDATHIIVVEDASPEPELREYCQSLATNTAITLLYHEKNRGFVFSVNEGMRLHPDRDVVLLNSDTRVANDWLHRMQAAAWSDKKIASVTPFSNNASICSFPLPHQANPLPEGYDVNALDKLFAEINPGVASELPTAVGFCMYIRRDCLNLLGYFDENSFGRGYGEENDFSLRASEAGWKNILADNVFVWHEGSVSFGDDRHDLMKRGGALLAARYPHYEQTVRQFISEDPLSFLRARVQNAMLINALAAFSTTNLPKVLMISHQWGGGVEQHLQDLLELLDGSARVLVLRGQSKGRVGVELVGEGGFKQSIGGFDDNFSLWLAALGAIGFDRIHLHHVHGWSPKVLKLIQSLALPLDVTLHDYYSISPSYHLGPKDDEKTLNEARTDDADGWPVDQHAWQALFLPVLSQADRVIAPSHDVARRVQKVFPQVAMQVEAHPEHPLEVPSLIKVALLGGLSQAKGMELVFRLATEAGTDSLPVCFRLIGHSAEPLPDSITATGTYEADQLGTLLAQERPDVIWFASQVHETFSYTLSAALAFGKPIVATDVGSFRERLQDVPNATLLPVDASIEQWLEAFRFAATKVTAPTGFKPRSLSNYRDFYLQYSSKNASPASSALLAEVLISAPAAIPEPAVPLKNLLKIGAYGGHRDSLKEVERCLSSLPDDEVAVASWREFKESADKLDDALDALEQYKQALGSNQQKLDEALDGLCQYRNALEQEQHSHYGTREVLEKRNNEFDAILKSSSWRITRPIRVIMRGCRKSVSILRRSISLIKSPSSLKRALHLYRRGGVTAIRERFQQEVRTATAPAPVVRQDHVETHLLLNKHPVFSPLMLLTNEKPVLSIVIPVYGQHDTTYNCLASIAANPPSVSYEVIVADDASPEAAADALNMVQGIRIVRHPDNLGFLGNSNAGVAAAKGEWLVLLNNDTLVCRNAFDALLNTFSDYPAAGLVGAKLLNADGSVQEAGGIIWRDGSGWNWGRNQHRDDPRLNYVRDADYCSGAVLAMRRDLFTDMGGFDTHFAPAYYEDTDLAFRIRQRGMRVLYQPAAEVYHLEGVSHGRDTNSGMKAWQVVNAEKFYQRWQSVLAGHRENAHQPELEAHRGTRGNILIIEACMITPDQDSGSIRMLNLLDLLRSQGYHVTFIADNLEYVEKYVHQLQQKGIEVYHTDWANGSVKSVLKQLGRDLDAVFVCRHYILKNYIDLLRELAPRAKVIFDTVDLHFVREEREAQLHQNAALQRASQITRRQELALVAKSDVTVVVSEFEKKLLADLLPQAKVEIISNIHNHEPQRPPYHEREGIIFVGGFRHPPNIDAITWYANDVLPLLRKLLPGVSTKVVGSNMPDTVRNLAAADLEMLGFIENIDPLLHAARISIAPLRYGAGVKGKVNEAMNYGIPVVATACAVEGMHLRPGEEVMVAESAEEFAKAIVAAYQDATLWQQLSTAGVENVKKHFSPAAALPAMKRILD
jgi:GT2 family glycosyltransferase/glycosyltransferase involved in cell wall biosynthesis